MGLGRRGSAMGQILAGHPDMAGLRQQQSPGGWNRQVPVFSCREEPELCARALPPTTPLACAHSPALCPTLRESCQPLEQ